jgi:5-hydroxyisourate hydrolase/2-oxo-4-hydroxy-4-carboxy-5-ureidoimidazoline decarboxylase
MFWYLVPGSPAVEAKQGDTPGAADVKQATTPSPAPASNLRPPITTHVLDVAVGKPGSGIDVALHLWTPNSASAGSSRADANEAHGFWAPVGNSVTNSDGRSGPLMTPSSHLQPGTYRITFHTAAYLARVHGNSEGSVFYPYAMVVFEVEPSQAGEHFHIPLLLAPYSFSTYRGS